MRKTVMLWGATAVLMAVGVRFIVRRRAQQVSPAERLQTAVAWAQRGEVRALPVLVSALGDGDAKVRFQAAAALGKIGTAAVPSLLKVLREGDADARAAAVGALEMIGDGRAVQELARLARSEPYVSVRARAVTALGRLGGSQAVSALADALKDSDDGVRLRAVEALGQAAGTRAVQAIAQALADPDEHVRRKAEEVLKDIGTMEARAALKTARQ